MPWKAESFFLATGRPNEVQLNWNAIGLGEAAEQKPRRVERWGGNASHARRVVFSGPEGAARAKWQQLHLALRQGTVDPVDPDGRVVERSWAPRLRTRW